MVEQWEPGLAATKLRPPVPPVPFVRRPRLDALLDAGVDGPARLVLLSAPAGSGKSALLASWLAGRTGATAWLQAEASDSDPTRFWTYLVDAVGQARGETVNRLKPVVVGSHGDDLVVVPALVNRLAEIPGPLVVVIDDYHLIDNAGVHRGMERLVDLCPASVTIVLATRIDPPFRLGRLRVRRQVVEVRGGDLRFDVHEASALLGTAARSLDRAHLDQLCGRTEGWAAGLVLAGLSLHDAHDPVAFVEAFRGDDQLVVDYLRDELLAAIDPGDRRRLLETSVLEQLSGPLVDAVTGRPGGAAWLRDTASRNQLVIGLDATGSWFRYHHLLRDLLRLEADRTFPERVPELHARAAAWFESQGNHRQAVVHRLAGGDLHGAAELLAVVGPRLLADGQSETLRGFLAQLGEVVPTSAWCALLSGWCEFLAGHYERSDLWLDTVAEVATGDFDPTLAISPRMNNSLARGDVGTALDAAREMTATDQLASHSCTLATVVGAAYAWAGRPDDARRTLRLAAEKALDEDVRAVHVKALVYQAVAELEGGSPASAQVAASAAVDAAEESGLTTYHGVAPAYAIRSSTCDDPVRTRADARHALESARRASTQLELGYVLTLCGDTLLDLGDPAGGPLLAEARTVIGRLPDPGVVRRRLARAQSRHGLAEPDQGRAPGLVEQLTERETAVLRYLPAAMSQRDIASQLYVSLNTVKSHCRAIYRKLGVGDRTAAVQAARDMDLL